MSRSPAQNLSWEHRQKKRKFWEWGAKSWSKDWGSQDGQGGGEEETPQPAIGAEQGQQTGQHSGLPFAKLPDDPHKELPPPHLHKNRRSVGSLG